MSNFTIVDERDLEHNVKFFRIQPTDVKTTLADVFASLSSLAWISNFDKDYIRDSFAARAKSTIEYIATNIISNNDDSITRDSGEYVVSELSRQAIVSKLSHTDIPLAELFKAKRSGNHGFDFYSVSPDKEIFFGEAKFDSATSAFSRAFEQINRFVNSEKRDIEDIAEITHFCCEESLVNFSKGEKGFAACFSSKSTHTDALIKFIKGNVNYDEFKKHKNLICVAVNL
jgi:hypothetical protein